LSGLTEDLFTPEQGREFVDIVHSLQPATLINGRVGNYEQEFLGDYQNMNDNGMPPGGLKENWETPQTLNDTWDSANLTPYGKVLMR